ncbi:hypothetical protein [Streptomyces sp. NPDC002763]|uniref:hypothetical protein n=1 Tax=Streptomyces sp. NPDC002763 TaxID=3154427 RepID=UPI00331686D4
MPRPARTTVLGRCLHVLSVRLRRHPYCSRAAVAVQSARAEVRRQDRAWWAGNGRAAGEGCRVKSSEGL